MGTGAKNRQLLLTEGWGPIIDQLDQPEPFRVAIRAQAAGREKAAEFWRTLATGWLAVDLASLLLDDDSLVVLGVLDAIDAAARFVSAPARRRPACRQTSMCASFGSDANGPCWKSCRRQYS